MISFNMKTILKIVLLSSFLYACNNSGDSNRPEVDTSNSSSLDSALMHNNKNEQGAAMAADPAAEAHRQLTETIIASKKAINDLESDISDSLSRSNLSSEKRSLFSKTIKQLEASSDVLNKQLEQILVSDLQANREKLKGIVIKMKGSQKELQTMIGKIDKISGYLETATNLIQSLSPIKPATTSK